MEIYEDTKISTVGCDSFFVGAVSTMPSTIGPVNAITYPLTQNVWAGVVNSGNVQFSVSLQNPAMVRTAFGIPTTIWTHAVQPSYFLLNTSNIICDETSRQAYSGNLDVRLKQAMDLESIGDISGALDIIYRCMDQTMREERFEEVDAFLAKLDASKLSVDITIAILIISRPACDRLPSREAFFKGAWNDLESRKRNARELLGELRHRPKGAGQSFSIGESTDQRCGNRGRWGLLQWFSRRHFAPPSRRCSFSPSVWPRFTGQPST